MGDEAITGVFCALLDRVVADAPAREAARLALSEQEAAGALEGIKTRLRAAAGDADPWTRRARPAFLYVMYALFLWALPMGVLAALRPATAAAIAAAMGAYLHALPEPLYTLFGTGYLGYTAARSWGKAKGVER